MRSREWATWGMVAVLLGVLVWILAFHNPFGSRVGDRPLAFGATSTTTTSSTTTTVATTTTSTMATTTTISEEQRLAEVEAILHDLSFGWLDAIYRKDADALWDVVATATQHDSGVMAIESLEFLEPPERADVVITEVEILLDRPDCLVASHHGDASAVLGAEALVDRVAVMWPDDRRGWRFASFWVYKGDLWLADCDDVVREETP